MSFVRQNIYRMNLDGRKMPRERIELCIEFFLAQSCPCAVAWIDQHMPENWTKDGVTDAKVVSSPKVYVYGRAILDKKKITAADMAMYFLADALAREAVVGKEAATLVHSVLWDWFIKAPKTVSKPLADAAPEWWALVTRKEGAQ